MTAPRPVYPDQFVFLSRRCTQRQFLLRPDDETNNAFVYCLAVAAHKYELEVVLAQMMSNHYHSMLYDRFGRVSEFMCYFHQLVAKCQNALRGRWENLWASEQPCVVNVHDRDALLDKMAYIATNPVKDQLVDAVHHWPGPEVVQALLCGRVLRATRPRHFFRDDGEMPEEVTLEVRLPEGFEDPETFLAELRTQIAVVEQQASTERQATGRPVLGRRRVLRQSWRDSATSREPRRTLRPRVSARSKWARIQALFRNKEFEADYRSARALWVAGLPAVFPFGTNWLRRFANVDVRPPPPPIPIAA